MAGQKRQWLWAKICEEIMLKQWARRSDRLAIPLIRDHYRWRACVVDRRLLPAVSDAGPLPNRGDFAMTGILLLLVVLLGGAAVVFWEAAEQISIGTGWASDVCTASEMFCHHPEYLAYAAGALLVIAIGVKLGSAAN
jgi:hypothetical protein